MTTQQAQQRPVFDKQDQLQKITANLMQGETVIAVYDCIGAGTGFVGITDRRVIIQDNSFVGKKVALTSVPYSKINSVSFVSDKSMWGNWAS
ncbi:MAG: PH domain-containing protein, partial [Nitrospiraceae bacterium]